MDYLQSIGGGVRQSGYATLDANYGMQAASITSSSAGTSKLGGSSIGSAAQVTGALMNAYAAYSAVKKQEYTSKYNKALIDVEKKIASIGFDLQSNRIRRSGERLLSTQRAIVSKSGFEVGGSKSAVIQDSIKEIQLDLFNVKFNKMVSDLQYDIQWKQQDIAQKTAKKTKVAAALNAFSGSIL